MADARFPVEMVGGVPVVTAPGSIDVTNADALREVMRESAARGDGTLVVDMTMTQFCDTAGLHALVGAHKQARADGGQLRLVIPGAQVLRILAITGLDDVIPTFTSAEEALAQ
jgi:anti-sigma B factor antagonist